MFELDTMKSGVIEYIRNLIIITTTNVADNSLSDSIKELKELETLVNKVTSVQELLKIKERVKKN